MRDEFSETTKRNLAARVGNICSNPGCRCHTSGPRSESSGVLNLGVAAHITAAALGGPRFEAALTHDERVSADNAIWLCQNCAKLVANDPLRFTAELLRAWRTSAEDEALRRIGRPVEYPSGEIEDKWCTLDYIEKAGIGPQLRDAGFALRWVRAKRVAEFVDLQGWEEVIWQDNQGKTVRFKAQDEQCQYLELLRKPEIISPAG